MTASNLQIVHLYEALGMSPSEIAASLEYEETAVKMVLASESPLYRKNVARQEESFSGDDANDAAQVLKSLMFNSDQDAVRYRCARYIYDEIKGRNDVQKLNGINVNVQIINERMKKAREAIDAAKAPKVIDV